MTPTIAEVIEADWTWTGDGFAPGVQVAVDPQGRIVAAGAAGRPTTRRLAGRALLPGMVNAHSHAFQRGLRGHGERFAEAGSFWSWRDAMYRLVETLDAGAFRALCLQAFREMRRGGITTVGEFHYFHHTSGTTDFAFDRLLVEAAREAGIRLVVLEAYYRTGGIAAPLAPPQRRFATPDPAAYWDAVDALTGTLDPAWASVGAVAHSIRAATPDEIAALHAEARRRGLVFHMHVEEQRREVEETRAAFGRTPMALLLDAVGDASAVTAVHCTHTAPDDLARFLALGGTVCVCPTTEANLGDGIPDLSQAAAPRLCLGTDSNARISMPEEMRWLEYGQRLARELRGALRPAGGHLARTLFEAATTGGAHALGVPAGRIAPGGWADFCVLDLSAPMLAGWTPDTLLDAFVFGADASVVAATCVGGHWD